MIELITGKPGAGKTLITLARLKGEAEKSSRPVYYSGITDCTLPWVNLDEGAQLEDGTIVKGAENWHKLPAGAMIIIDEAQRVFRPRAVGSKVPEHVEMLETHRHKGHDIYVITQHPMLIDNNVRRLTGKHTHVVRAFGAKFATLHEWPQVNEQCDKNRADSIEKKWVYPTEVFSWYKSAEVHTHKSKIPFRLIFLVVIAPLLIGGLVWWFAGWYGKQKAPELKKRIDEAGIVEDSARPIKTSETVREESTEEYVKRFTPRIPTLPHTAPAYDEVMQVRSAPLIVGCLTIRDECRCYTEQSTRVLTSDVVCRQWVKAGHFDYTLPSQRSSDAISDRAKQPRSGAARSDPSTEPDLTDRQASPVV